MSEYAKFFYHSNGNQIANFINDELLSNPTYRVKSLLDVTNGVLVVFERKAI